MRPYPVVEDEPEDEPTYPRVIPISSGVRARAQPSNGQAPRHEPWTPRDPSEFQIPRRAEPAAPAPPPPSPITQTHRFMLVVFILVCVGMIVAMVSWRLWIEPRLAAEPAAPTAAQAEPRPPANLPAAPAPTDAPATGTGAVTTEIRVLQPNYTVAPGDTLASIARRRGTTIEALASINNLENRNSLSVGQRLIIP